MFRSSRVSGLRCTAVAAVAAASLTVAAPAMADTDFDFGNGLGFGYAQQLNLGDFSPSLAGGGKDGKGTAEDFGPDAFPDDAAAGGESPESPASTRRDKIKLRVGEKATIDTGNGLVDVTAVDPTKGNKSACAWDWTCGKQIALWGPLATFGAVVAWGLCDKHWIGVYCAGQQRSTNPDGNRGQLTVFDPASVSAAASALPALVNLGNGYSGGFGVSPLTDGKGGFGGLMLSLGVTN